MEKIIMKRGYGKTFQLIKKSALTGDYIVCQNQSEASRIQSEALKLKLNIPFPITYDEFNKGQYAGHNISGFLIDNIEIFLQQLTNVPINAVSLNQ
jgi:predicted transport protein